MSVILISPRSTPYLSADDNNQRQTIISKGRSRGNWSVSLMMSVCKEGSTGDDFVSVLFLLSLSLSYPSLSFLSSLFLYSFASLYLSLLFLFLFSLFSFCLIPFSSLSFLFLFSLFSLSFLLSLFSFSFLFLALLICL